MNRLFAYLACLLVLLISLQIEGFTQPEGPPILGRVAAFSPVYRDISSPQMESYPLDTLDQGMLREVFAPSVPFTIEFSCKWKDYYRIKMIAGENTYLINHDALIHVARHLRELNDATWRERPFNTPATLSTSHPLLGDLPQCVVEDSLSTPIPQIAEVTTREAPSPQPMVSRGEDPETPSSQTYHRVKKGETLWRIAQHYQVSVEALMEVNQLHSPKIYTRQALYIPKDFSPDKASQRHTVQAGETLWRIAQQHQTTVEALAAANRLATYDIKSGQQLLIPQ